MYRFSKIKFFFLVLTTFSSIELFANCELMRQGYHTIATYQSKWTKSNSILRYKVNDPFIYLNNFDQFISRNKENAIDFDMVFASLKKVSHKDQICDVKKENQIVSSAASNILSIKVNNCLKKNPVEDSGISVFNKKLNTLYIPENITFRNNDKGWEKLDSKIKKEIKKVLIKGSDEYIIDTKKAEVKEIKNTIIDKAGTVYSSVTLSVRPVGLEANIYGTKGMVKEYLFYVVLLSNQNGEIWHVADSGQNHCDKTIEKQFRKSKKIDGYELGYELDVFSSSDIDNDGEVDLITFGHKDITYYVDFGKELTVIQDDSYRIESWNENYKTK